MSDRGLAPWVGEAVRRRAGEFAAQLRSGVDGAASVPGMEWSVAELAQHVASLPDYWTSFDELADGFEQPDDWTEFFAKARSHIDDRDPARLADLIDGNFDEFLDWLTEGEAQAWLYGQQVDKAIFAGFALNELILHGRDLAGATGAAEPTFERREANLAADAVVSLMPVFVDPAKASAQPDGVYRVSFRDGNDYTWIKEGSTLAVEPGRPPKADADLIADQATFLLASLGRISQLRAGLSGKMISYGRRPWRFLGLGSIAVDSV